MYTQKNSSTAPTTRAAAVTATARTTMLGVVLLAAVCLASATHPQTLFSDDLARRLTERSDLQYDRVREFERMFRLYQVPPPGNVWQEIPTEGRAVKE